MLELRAVCVGAVINAATGQRPYSYKQFERTQNVDHGILHVIDIKPFSLNYFCGLQ